MKREVKTKNENKQKSVQLVLTPLIDKQLFLFSLDVVSLNEADRRGWEWMGEGGSAWEWVGVAGSKV